MGAPPNPFMDDLRPVSITAACEMFFTVEDGSNVIVAGTSDFLPEKAMEAEPHFCSALCVVHDLLKCEVCDAKEIAFLPRISHTLETRCHTGGWIDTKW